VTSPTTLASNVVSTSLRHFLTTAELEPGSAGSFLRLAYAVSFLAQVVVAALVAVVVRALAGGPGGPSALLAWLLVAFAVMELPIALLVTARMGAAGSRRSALTAAILAGTMLASSAWFAALALATGQRGTPVFLLLSLVTIGYAVGFFAVGRLARTPLDATGSPSRVGGGGSAPEEE
jgi:drug/metabolite transporter (DMT)-like permease